MNDDNNIDETEIDADEDLDLGGESFDNFEKKRISLSPALKDKPIVKLGIIALVFVLIVGVIMYFRTEMPAVISSVPSGAEVNAPPGTTEVSPAIRDAIVEADEQRQEEAQRTGGSALPTLIEPPVGRIQLPDDEAPEEDPLQRWRRLQEERVEREAERARLLQPENLQDESISAEQIAAMAAAMSAQMEAILSGKKPPQITNIEITDAGYLEQLNPPAAVSTDVTPQTVIQEIVLPAGQIVYAQLITEANSDVPGPVLAQIVTGPLKGARVLGTFDVQEEELLTLTFNTIVRDGVSSGIQAIALDPATTLPGMATDVDHRYLRRIVLPAAAAFVEGAAEAVSDSGTTTITINGGTTTSTTSNDQKDSKEQISAGIEEAAGEVSDMLDDLASKTKVMVKMRSGTPMGLLFLQPVLKN